MANPEEPPKIDWSYYKANAVNKAVVEQFEKAYTSLKIPYPNDKGALNAVIAEEKETVSKRTLLPLITSTAHNRAEPFSGDVSMSSDGYYQ